MEEVKQFLRSKPGYLKKSGIVLSERLFDNPTDKNVADCYQALSEVKLELREADMKPQEQGGRVLIYDIETSPNIGWFWRAGYKLNISPENITKERAIICVSYKWLGEDEVYNLSWDKNQCDKFLIEQFIEVMNEADMLVAHNGDRFDLKWIKTRALKHGITTMLIDYKSLDTLKLAKKKFNFNSNRLDYIAKYLGFEGKIKTSIGLWTDIVFKKDPQALKDMITYCDEDVRQLENVYCKLVGWEKPSFHAGVLEGKEKFSSPINGGYNLKLVKIQVTTAGTRKHIIKDLDTDRMFEMNESNWNKYKEHQSSINQ
jgi:DNA polymerase III epsilon subunit-like protein|tara:strand:+ start:5229 stop:6173 length:945 start_codon:yes stop_codon:yes gene_type:complete